MRPDFPDHVGYVSKWYELAFAKTLHGLLIDVVDIKGDTIKIGGHQSFELAIAYRIYSPGRDTVVTDRTPIVWQTGIPIAQHRNIKLVADSAKERHQRIRRCFSVIIEEYLTTPL